MRVLTFVLFAFAWLLGAAVSIAFLVVIAWAIITLVNHFTA